VIPSKTQSFPTLWNTISVLSKKKIMEIMKMKILKVMMTIWMMILMKKLKKNPKRIKKIKKSLTIKRILLVMLQELIKNQLKNLNANNNELNY